jgi:hypothetical protein
MGLESATHIFELDPNNPDGAADPKSQGDDHLRMIKACLLTDLPNIGGVVNASHTELNHLVGVSSGIQAQLNGKQATINLTANRAVVSNGSGQLAVSAATATEIGHLSGVTSAIQTQLNGKLATNGNGGSLTNLNASNIASGTLALARMATPLSSAVQTAYTPTSPTQVNCTISTISSHRYFRIGNIVVVFGTTTVNTGGSGLASFELTLPVASNFANFFDLIGMGFRNGTVGSAFANVYADTGNNRAEIAWS